jgi:hypothetical protein
MKLLVAAIYTNFETSIVDDIGIKPMDGYMGGPQGGMLIVRFDRVKS